MESNYGGSTHDGAEAGIEAANGNFIMAGMTTRSGPGNEDVYLVSCDHAGNKTGERAFGGKAKDIAYSLIETREAYVMSGITYSTGNGGHDFFFSKSQEN